MTNQSNYNTIHYTNIKGVKMNENTVEAEIIEDDFKAPVLKDIKYPVKQWS